MNVLKFILPRDIRYVSDIDQNKISTYREMTLLIHKRSQYERENFIIRDNIGQFIFDKQPRCTQLNTDSCFPQR